MSEKSMSSSFMASMRFQSVCDFLELAFFGLAFFGVDFFIVLESVL